MHRGRVRFASGIFFSCFMKIIHSPLRSGYKSKVMILDALKSISTMPDKFSFWIVFFRFVDIISLTNLIYEI